MDQHHYTTYVSRERPRRLIDIEDVTNTAAELKYHGLIKTLLAEQLKDPSDSFVGFILGEIYDGRRTKALIEGFKGVVKKSLNQYIHIPGEDKRKPIRFDVENADDVFRFKDELFSPVVKYL